MAEHINNRILLWRQLHAKLGIGRTAIHERLNPHSPHYDPSFPRPIKLGNGPRPRNGWIESEVDKWIEVQAEKSRALDRRAA